MTVMQPAVAACVFPPRICDRPWSPFVPWPGVAPDYELERLRQLKRAREVEEEKERLRDWLSRHGVPCPSPCLPPWFPPPPACRGPSAFRPLSPHDVLRRVG